MAGDWPGHLRASGAHAWRAGHPCCRCAPGKKNWLFTHLAAEVTLAPEVLTTASLRRVEMPETGKNDFHLNISRYLSTAVGVEEIDLEATNATLMEIEETMQTAAAKQSEFLNELGLPVLPG